MLFKKIRVSAPDCTAVSVNKNVFSEKGKIIGRRRRERTWKAIQREKNDDKEGKRGNRLTEIGEKKKEKE